MAYKYCATQDDECIRDLTDDTPCNECDFGPNMAALEAAAQEKIKAAIIPTSKPEPEYCPGMGGVCYMKAAYADTDCKQCPLYLPPKEDGANAKDQTNE